MCNFSVQILNSEQQEVLRLEFTKNGDGSVDLTGKVLEPPALVIATEGRVEVCFGADCEFQQAGLVTVTVGEAFQVRVFVTDPNLALMRLTENDIWMKGEGTQIKIKPSEVDEQVPGQITYTLAIPIATKSQLKLQVSATVVPTARRRVLAESQKITQELEVTIQEGAAEEEEDEQEMEDEQEGSNNALMRQVSMLLVTLLVLIEWV